MSRLIVRDFSNLKTLEDLIKVLSEYTGELTPIISGGIQFGDNIQSQTVSVKFLVANEDLSIGHNLERTGVNFIVTNKDVSTDIYHGVGADTTSTIFLRSTVAPANVTLYLV